jgi:hypothetical protein
MQGSEACAASVAMMNTNSDLCSGLRKASEIEQIWSDLRKKPERKSHD